MSPDRLTLEHSFDGRNYAVRAPSLVLSPTKSVKIVNVDLKDSDMEALQVRGNGGEGVIAASCVCLSQAAAAANGLYHVRLAPQTPDGPYLYTSALAVRGPHGVCSHCVFVFFVQAGCETATALAPPSPSAPCWTLRCGTTSPSTQTLRAR